VATETNNGKVSEEEAAERRPTERVILQHSFVIKLPGGGVDREVLEKVIKLLELKGPNGRAAKPQDVLGEAWVEVSRKVGSSKRAAIEEYAGKAGTPDAKVGVFRAPSTTAWKGGVENTAPPLPLVESRVIE
jgi:hypothetical protein